MSAPAKPRKRKLGHDPVSGLRRLDELRPAPENDELYRPVLATDPEILRLAESVRERGLLEPLVVTQDGYILSGHRRHVAARLAGLDRVPVRVEPIRRADDLDSFVVLLREYNRQREKSREERLREELVTIEPDDAYQSLIAHRAEHSTVEVPSLRIRGAMRRSEISPAKAPLLAAIQRILEEHRRFWPLSDRRIHYSLLNNPPLKHASKSTSRYRNDGPSYKALVELLTRARITGEIPFAAIADTTRPVTVWRTWREVGGFIAEAKGELFKGYWRDLQQSQPNHIEIVAEKNTVEPILRPVAMRYCVPLTSGRGYCSLPPRHEMATRYQQSGKRKLVLLVVSDFDPDGEEIAQSFARSMRDDFDVEAIHPIKVALTAEQVKQYRLPPGEKAKATSAQYAKFRRLYGDAVYELEAIDPATLQELLTAAIDSVLDRAAFNEELDREKEDAHFLEGVRRTALRAIGATVEE